MNPITKPGQLRVVISAEQLQKRVREMARQISDDYRDRTIHILGILENGFMFMADLVRALDVPVICQFIKPRYRQQPGNGLAEGAMEIFFSHDADIRGHHVLLVEGLVHSGVTSEFLMSDLQARGFQKKRYPSSETPTFSIFPARHRSSSRPSENITGRP